MADQTNDATISFDLTREEREEIAKKASETKARHGISVKTDLKAGVDDGLAFSAHNHLFDENFDSDFGETEATAG